jgi:hypothetical protein
MFHSGNVPFTLNEDMVVRDLKIASTNDNGFEFQSTEVETQQLAQDIIDGKVDAVRVVFDNKALQNQGEMDKYGYIYPPIYINLKDSNMVVLGMVMFAVPNKKRDQVIQQITIDGLPGNRGIVTCSPLDGFFWNIN